MQKLLFFSILAAALMGSGCASTFSKQAAAEGEKKACCSKHKDAHAKHAAGKCCGAEGECALKTSEN